MGRPIVYCDGCGLSLREEEFERGRAVTLRNRNFCIACKPAEEPDPAATPTPRRGTSSATPYGSRKVSTAHISIPTPRHGIPRAPSRPSSSPLWIGLGVAVAAILLALIALGTSRGGPRLRGPALGAPPAAVNVPATRAPVEPAPIRPDEAALTKERETRFLEDIEKAIENPRTLGRRREELLRMIAVAEQGGSRVEAGRLRLLLERRLREASLAQGLVGHWTLDDHDGGTAKDSGPLGLHGTLQGQTRWCEGRLKGALALDGRGWVEIPGKGPLQRLNHGSYSISAWYKPALVPPGRGDANDAYHGIVIRAGYHVGLTFSSEGSFGGTDWQDNREGTRLGSAPVAVGVFHHVVWSLDREARSLRLHVDGRLAGEKLLNGRPGLDRGDAPWRMGVAHPTQDKYAWFARGVIDEVRLYDRALSAEEARRLFELAP